MSLRPGQVHPAPLHHRRHPAAHRFPADALRALVCPHCRATLAATADLLSCANGHTFDVARQGYVALLSARARTDTGDSADMVAARADFLGAGHYAPIAAAVAQAVAGVSGPILEIGSGTGYYLGAAMSGAEITRAEVTSQTCGGAGSEAVHSEAGVSGIALDASKFAARRAAADRRVVSVVADAWSALPVGDRSVGAVLSIFAPRDVAEIVRVLRHGGPLVAVTPEPGHLAELRDLVDILTVDEGKAERLADSIRLPVSDQRRLDFRMSLGADDLSALVRMGPSARHVTAGELAERIARIDAPVIVTASVTMTTFS